MFVYWRVNSLSNTECLNLWLWTSMGIPWSKMKLWESRFDPVYLWEKKVHQILSSLTQYVSISLNFKPPTPIESIMFTYIWSIFRGFMSGKLGCRQIRNTKLPRFWGDGIWGFEGWNRNKVRRPEVFHWKVSKNVKFGGWNFATLDLCVDFCCFRFGIWKVRLLRLILDKLREAHQAQAKYGECADFQMLFQLDDFKSVKKDWLIHLSLEGKPPGASNTSVFSFVITSNRCNGYFWYQMIAQPVPLSCHGPWSFSAHLPYKLQVCYYVSSFQLNWLVLSDEQMSKGWQFFLLYINDEQMSNWSGWAPGRKCFVFW